jgi:octaprenyl-diphosphate synthase
LSKDLLLSIDNGDFDLLKIISVAVREMSEGSFKSKSKKVSLQRMFITKLFEKTATLIAAVVLGAKSVIEDEAQVENMRKFRTHRDGVSNQRMFN